MPYLAGLKLIGFSVWERRGGSGRNVTFPARQYAINGERRSFALLRPIVDTSAQDGTVGDVLLASESKLQTLSYVGGSGREESATPLLQPCSSICPVKLAIYLQGEPPVVHFVHLVTDETGRAF
jgi:hypothetical protein